MVAPSKFAHVVYNTCRYEEMIAWYERVFEAQIQHGNDRLTFLTYDDEHHRLAIVNTADAPDAPTGCAGVDHIAFTLASLGDLLSSFRRLHNLGILPHLCINHGPTTSLYYRDPDGNQVELQVDNFDTPEALKGWFESEDFAQNPIGVTFDPDKLIERFEAGHPIEELVKQGSA